MQSSLEFRLPRASSPGYERQRSLPVVFFRCSVSIKAMEERRSRLGRYEYIAPCEEGGAILSLM